MNGVWDGPALYAVVEYVSLLRDYTNLQKASLDVGIIAHLRKLKDETESSV